MKKTVKTITIKRTGRQLAEDISRAERKLHQDIPRHKVIASGKLYDRRREKSACRSIEE